MIWHNKRTSGKVFEQIERWSMPPQIFSIILKGDQCLLKYSQIFSKVINASSNILIYWFVGGAFREHFTKIFQVKTWTISLSSLIIIITIENNRHQPVQHHHEQYYHHHQHHLKMPSKSTTHNWKFCPAMAVLAKKQREIRFTVVPLLSSPMQHVIIITKGQGHLLPNQTTAVHKCVFRTSWTELRFKMGSK